MRFGVLGDAKIARTKLLPAIRAAGHKVTHLGRRDASAGADPAWGPVTVTSYDELLQDPQVDAVYNALPNHLHVPWSLFHVRRVEDHDHVQSPRSWLV